MRELKTFLKEKDMSIYSICNRLDLAHSVIYRFVRNESSNPIKTTDIEKFLAHIKGQGFEGEVKAVKKSNAKKTIFAKLKVHRTYSQSQVRSLTTYKEGTVRQVLTELMRDNKLIRIKRDNYKLA